MVFDAGFFSLGEFGPLPLNFDLLSLAPSSVFVPVPVFVPVLWLLLILNICGVHSRPYHPSALILRALCWSSVTSGIPRKALERTRSVANTVPSYQKVRVQSVSQSGDREKGVGGSVASHKTEVEAVMARLAFATPSACDL